MLNIQNILLVSILVASIITISFIITSKGYSDSGILTSSQDSYFAPVAAQKFKQKLILFLISYVILGSLLLLFLQNKTQYAS